MKQGLAFVLTIIGAGAMIYGIYMIFSGGVTDNMTWVAAVLGVIFFGAGIGLLKTTKDTAAAS